MCMMRTVTTKQRWYCSNNKMLSIISIFMITLMTKNVIASNTTNGNTAIDLLRQSTCTLNCVNNGTCQYVSNNVNELQSMMQSGKMIMYCTCPNNNYVGMGCEQQRPLCNIQTMKCPNNAPCENSSSATTTATSTSSNIINHRDEQQQYHCDCSIADQISTRTSNFCRHTYTEYCTSSNDIVTNPVIFFCTNGGKCKGDLIAAQIAPGNTSINTLYEYDGCICPPEYYGPHCEFMYQNRSSIYNNNNNKDDGTNPLPSATLAPTFAQSTTSSEIQTIDPTSVSNTDDDGESLEDLINKYTNQTKANTESNTISKSEQQRQIVRIVLCSVFISLFLVGVGLYYIRYTKHSKQKRFLLLQKTFIPHQRGDSATDSKYQSPPSVTGSIAASSTISTASSFGKTVKTGSKSRRYNETQEIDTTMIGSQYLTPLHSKRNRKQSKSHYQLSASKNNDRSNTSSTRTSSSVYMTDDTDIISLTNDSSYHRRYSPQLKTIASTSSVKISGTPFVVDDDDDNVVDNDNDICTVKEMREQAMVVSRHQNRDGLWVYDSIGGNSRDQILPQQHQQQQQSWIVSLSNRAINFTEIVRPPIIDYDENCIISNNNNNSSSNTIYLVDDEDDNEANVGLEGNENNRTTRYLNKFVEHL